MELKYIYTDMEWWGALFCFLASVHLFLGRSVSKKEYRTLAAIELIVGIMLVFDGLAWYYRGVPGSFAFNMVSLANFITFVINAILPVFFSLYVVLSVYGEKKDFTIFYVCAFLAIFAEILLLLSQRSGYIYRIDPTTNLYQRGSGFIAWTVINLSEALIGIAYLTYNHKKIEKNRFIAVLSFIVLPILAGIIQVFLYGFSLSNIAFLISALFMFAQAMGDNVKSLIEQRVMITTQQSELSNLKTKIAMSQIQPQFLYEALEHIEKMCDIEPEKAKNLITKLSQYLKGNVRFSERDELIPFTDEIEHTKAYLEIEKEVLEDAFEPEYNIKATDFDLPALTLQPIVENAIEHGISKLAPGTKGLVKISTVRGNGYIKITIKDNGVGFDTEAGKDNLDDILKPHGIKNVKERLRIMENAEIHIKSVSGSGTTVEIIIPR
ncbi:MAG: histidine kinase [Butyrivibrio sp.]|nr:histidine kinase [Butyrivibrio sp.]